MNQSDEEIVRITKTIVIEGPKDWAWLSASGNALVTPERLKWNGGPQKSITLESLVGPVPVEYALHDMRTHHAQHTSVPLQIWIDVDVNIADTVTYLNTIDGVRTHASCQGTIGEGGPNPYRAQVMCSWSQEALVRLKKEFDVNELGDGWGYVHPR